MAKLLTNSQLLADYDLFKDVFESITIYMHITSRDVTDDPNNAGFTIRYCRLTISNVPFTDPDWEKKCYHHEIKINDNVPVEYIEDDTFEQATDFMILISKILTIQGHEVYNCEQLNPGPKIGSYAHFSGNVKQTVDQLRKKTNA